MNWTTTTEIIYGFLNYTVHQILTVILSNVSIIIFLSYIKTVSSNSFITNLVSLTNFTTKDVSSWAVIFYDNPRDLLTMGMCT